ncbi:hypothetical protein [Micromonospora sp. LH3U1]|uniref:hypothetical protein n=1 Tax=Micromonospora sp. LH3U1 TaxID=3018339 RepID=UPI00234A9A93|nr:hypothetical protein [Micromonospora sp. LH3U1]WCN79277.1 hypothetical protein PCA76_19890 [Micromonospora sp. LH3U1]
MPELTLFADYRQIHVFDEAADEDLDDEITDEALGDGLVVGRCALIVCTEVSVDVAVLVEVSAQPPVDDVAAFDHVVEGSIEVSSGRLVVMGCTDYLPDATRVEVPAGWLRVRASRANLAAAQAADIDSAEDSATMERLRIQLWPAPPAARTVLRHWQSAGENSQP